MREGSGGSLIVRDFIICPIHIIYSGWFNLEYWHGQVMWLEWKILGGILTFYSLNTVNSLYLSLVLGSWYLVGRNSLYILVGKRLLEKPKSVWEYKVKLYLKEIVVKVVSWIVSSLRVPFWIWVWNFRFHKSCTCLLCRINKNIYISLMQNHSRILIH